MSEIKIYKLEDVAELLDCNKRTLYKYIKAGSLKAVKIGKSWKVRHADLEEFLKNGTKGS